MKIKLITTAVFATSLMASTGASAQIFGGLDNNSLIGATLGSVIGSQLAGSGARTEGSAIGAVLGGLAGSAMSSRSNYYGGYIPAYGFGYGASGNNGLVGAGIGATLGGVIGSQLAGSGARTEGSAIGAVLGGLAGYGIANKAYGRSSRYGSSAPVSYGTFGGYPSLPSAPVYAPAPMPSVQYIQGPSYVSSYSSYNMPQSYMAPALGTVRHVYKPAQVITNKVIHHQPIVTKTIHITKPEYRSEVEYVQAPATYSAPAATYSAPATTYTNTYAGTNQSVLCYAGSSKRYDALGNLITGSSSANYGYESYKDCN